MPMARVSDARSASEVSNSVEQLHPRLCWGWPGHDPGPNQRSGFVDGQGETCQRRPRTEQTHAFQLCWCLPGLRAGAFTCVQGRSALESPLGFGPV